MAHPLSDQGQPRRRRSVIMEHAEHSLSQPAKLSIKCQLIIASRVGGRKRSIESTFRQAINTGWMSMVELLNTTPPYHLAQIWLAQHVPRSTHLAFGTSPCTTRQNILLLFVIYYISSSSAASSSSCDAPDNIAAAVLPKCTCLSTYSIKRRCECACEFPRIE